MKEKIQKQIGNTREREMRCKREGRTRAAETREGGRERQKIDRRQQCENGVKENMEGDMKPQKQIN